MGLRLDSSRAKGNPKVGWLLTGKLTSLVTQASGPFVQPIRELSWSFDQSSVCRWTE